MKIIQKIVPKSVTNVRPGRAMTPRFITIHETDNTSKGADAAAHAQYLLNGAGGRTASWHFTVDDKSIYQHLPTNEHGWHAGDGGGGTGNRQSIGIEICVNSDGNFNKAVQNAAWLVRKLMKDHNIPITNVVQHNRWSGKNCPRNLRKKGWSAFIESIKKGGTQEVSKRDINKVSEWAKNDWEHATKLGIVDGKRPGATATREEVAIMILRAIQKIGK